MHDAVFWEQSEANVVIVSIPISGTGKKLTRCSERTKIALSLFVEGSKLLTVWPAHATESDSSLPKALQFHSPLDPEPFNPGQGCVGVSECISEATLTLGMSILLPRTRTGTWDSASSPSSASSSFLDSRKRSRSTASTRKTSASTCTQWHRTTSPPNTATGERVGPSDTALHYLLQQCAQLLIYHAVSLVPLVCHRQYMRPSAARLPCFPDQGVQLSCLTLRSPLDSRQQRFELSSPRALDSNFGPTLKISVPLAKGKRDWCFCLVPYPDITAV